MEETLVLDLNHPPIPNPIPPFLPATISNPGTDAHVFSFARGIDNIVSVELMGYSVRNAYADPVNVGISRDPYFLVSFDFKSQPTTYVNGLKTDGIALSLSQELPSTDVQSLTTPMQLMSTFGKRAERFNINQVTVRVRRPAITPIGTDSAALYDRIVLYLRVIRENNAINQPGRQNMLNAIENDGHLRETEYSESRRVIQQIRNQDLY